MSKAAGAVRAVADGVKIVKSDEFKQMEDQLFEEISTQAKKGLFGTMITVEIPWDNQDELASLIGSIRHGGFYVETLQMQEAEYKTAIIAQMMITW